MGTLIGRPPAYPLVLASASPRRQDILRLLGLPFVVETSDVDESTLEDEPAEALAQRLAAAKAVAVARRVTPRYIIGADTVVVHGAKVLGKPVDATDATRMLRDLRGREHAVISGVAVVDRVAGRTTAGSLRTRVSMRDYADDEITRYVAAGEPFDKAGGYAIQDPDFRPVASIEGCYLNVVGLPLCLLLYLLWEAGLAVSPPPPAVVFPHCPNCVLV
ncbi:MAG: Maf family protein [Dehalococcoidales bacterium]|nr:Maf family protein [Dehalococcoidales bacterium]